MQTLVGEHRLVTVAGPGGVGKTRLAIEAARRLAPFFRDGTHFVDLSTTAAGEPIVEGLLRALSLPTEIARKGEDGIRSFFANRRALIVLDNCEHVVEACGAFICGLLREAPRVSVLATSREPLGLQTERTLSLAPMSVSDAVDLFLERGRRVAGIEQGDLVRTVRICEQLDRLPLALELAAGMLSSLTIEDIERHLADRFALLQSRDPGVSPRHRSLSSVIAWSYELLKEEERRAFVHAAQFAGSFTLDAFIAVCGGTVTTLTSLVQKSILSRDDPASGRYRLPLSTAAFASQLLADGPERTLVRDAHARYDESVVATSRTDSFWRREQTWLDEVERDFENVASAFEWTLRGSGDRELGIRIALGTAPYFDRRGHYELGVAWIGASLAVLSEDSELHAALLAACSQAETKFGRYENALAMARASATMCERLGLERMVGRARAREGAVLIWLGRRNEALEPLLRAGEIARRTGDVRTQALVHGNLASSLRYEDARRAREEDLLALHAAESIGDRGLMSIFLGSMAYNEFLAERYAQARILTERALELQRAFGDVPAAAESLIDLGDVAVMELDLAGAQRRYREALSLADSFGLPQTSGRAIVGFAALATEAGYAAQGARLLGFAEAINQGPYDGHSAVTTASRIRARALREIPESEFEQQFASGRLDTRDDVIPLIEALDARAAPVT